MPLGCQYLAIFAAANVTSTGMLQPDTLQHKGLRQQLVNELRARGVATDDVLAAMGRVPRHCFFDSGFLRFAYSDKAFPIGAGQTISQPSTVAFQTSLLRVEPQQRVLEVGTGSGYQTAVLVELGAQVYTIERQRELFLRAQTLLGQMRYRAHFAYGDGHKGLPGYAPFQRIMVTAGATAIPPELLAQLDVGGRMVIPVGPSGQQLMTLVERLSPTELRTSTHGSFKFVPMLQGRE